AGDQRARREVILFAVGLRQLLDAGERFVDVLGLGVVRDAIQELVAERAEVGAARARGVVARARRRRARVEVLGRLEALSEEARSDGVGRRRGLAAPIDQRSVGLMA